MACPAPAPDTGLVKGLLDTVDCNVQSLAETGYGALAAPGSPVSAALTALLTIYIAVMGYRMLIGHAPLRVGDLTLTMLKIAAVLALATNWPTYQELVFNTLFRGPEELAQALLTAIQPAGSPFRSNPFAGLQVAYDELQRSAVYLTNKSPGMASPLQGGNPGAAFALNAAGFLLLMTSLGTVLAAKIVLGLLLGLGPVFVAFLLFDSTRGIFEGWLRAALAFAMVPLLAVMGLVVQLILLEPHIARLADLRIQGLVDLEPANAAFLLTVIGSLVTAALLMAVAVIALGFRLPWGQGRPAEAPAGRAPAAAADGAQGAAARTPALEQQSRVAAVAQAAAAMDRREGRPAVVVEAGVAGPAGGRGVSTGRADPTGPIRAAPFGQTYRRAALTRAAASSIRRDR